MGCDIHPVVEIRRKGVWRTHTPKTECSWYYEWEWDPITKGRRDKLDADGNKIRATWDRCKYALPDYFTSRDYLTFAILADVRNDGSVKPISVARGLPFDMDPNSRPKLSNEHSETWVDLQELMDYDMTAPMDFDAHVPEADYIKAMVTRKDPENWVSAMYGTNTVLLEPDEYVQLFRRAPGQSRTYDPTKNYYIHHRWMSPVGAWRETNIPEMIDYMKLLIPKGGTPSDVRIVMDFDS